MMEEVPEPLVRFFEDNPTPALAFSGGTDSTYLMYVCRALDVDMAPFFVRSVFQTDEEAEAAKNLSDRYGFELRLLEHDVLSDGRIAANTRDRCYLCKTKVFSMIRDAASKDGRACIIDGTNASDDPGERPGMRALSELGIRSPLRECGIGKQTIRMLSKEAGIPTWDLPSDSCLATRIPFGTALTEKLLNRTYCAEKGIKAMGFSDIRVRTMGSGARLEVPKGLEPLLEEEKGEVEALLLKYYDSVSFGERKS